MQQQKNNNSSSLKPPHSISMMDHQERHHHTHGVNGTCGAGDPDIVRMFKLSEEMNKLRMDPTMKAAFDAMKSAASAGVGGDRGRQTRQGGDGDAIPYTPLVMRLEKTYLDDEMATYYCAEDNWVGRTITVGSGGLSQECLLDDGRGRSRIFTQEKRDFLNNEILPASQDLVASALSVSAQPTDLVLTGECAGLPVPLAVQSFTDRFLLFVTAGPTPGSIVAWAGRCAVLPDGRSYAGLANFCPRYMTPDNRALLIETGVHEIFHALGFSPQVWNEYGMGGDFNFRGRMKYGLNSPMVLQKYKEHLGCDTLDPEAVEIEDEGQAGSAGSHWDSRVLIDDIMAAAAGIYLSPMTLAVFDDIPGDLFRVNYDVARSNAFGHNAGCGFANDAVCTNDDARTPGEFCDEGNFQPGMCGVGYNARSNACRPTTYSDGCSVATAWGVCYDPLQSYPSNVEEEIGETRAENSRCFDGVNIKQDWIGLDDAQYPQFSARCFVSKCMPDGVTIQLKVRDSDWFDCTDGARVDLSDQPGGLTGYSGEIVCPSYEAFCPQRDCEAGMGSTDGNNCAPCVPGQYAPAGIGHQCQPCSVGTWSDLERAESCANTCPLGQTTLSAGAIAESECVDCPPGTIGEANGVCSPCGPGTFGAGGGTQCMPCQVGTYSNEDSAASCAGVCPEGTSSPEGSRLQDDCVGGQDFTPQPNTATDAPFVTDAPKDNNQSTINNLDGVQSSGSDDNSIWYLVGGILGALLLSCILALLAFFIVRSRREKSEVSSATEAPLLMGGLAVQENQHDDKEVVVAEAEAHAPTSSSAPPAAVAPPMPKKSKKKGKKQQIEQEAEGPEELPQPKSAVVNDDFASDSDDDDFSASNSNIAESEADYMEL